MTMTTTTATAPAIDPDVMEAERLYHAWEDLDNDPEAERAAVLAAWDAYLEAQDVADGVEV
jgi:hypothetical protein